MIRRLKQDVSALPWRPLRSIVTQHWLGSADDYEPPILTMVALIQFEPATPNANAQVLEELPDKIRKRIPIEVDAAHR